MCVQDRGDEQLETALCIRRVDVTTSRTYSVVASNHLRTAAFPVTLHFSAYIETVRLCSCASPNSIKFLHILSQHYCGYIAAK